MITRFFLLLYCSPVLDVARTFQTIFLLRHSEWVVRFSDIDRPQRSKLQFFWFKACLYVEWLLFYLITTQLLLSLEWVIFFISGKILQTTNQVETPQLRWRLIFHEWQLYNFFWSIFYLFSCSLLFLFPFYTNKLGLITFLWVEKNIA